jgi:hypothetical protein
VTIGDFLCGIVRALIGGWWRWVAAGCAIRIPATTCGLGRERKIKIRRKPAMRKVLVVCLAICFVFALTALAFDDMGKSTTVNGWVTDAKCGAKMASASGEACTKKCLAAGAKLVIVTDGSSKVLTVDNQDAITGHAGHHVAVTGTQTADSIHVDSVKML